ncbi:MAG TPA: hypothetical protein ENJ29_11915 [Bacteroidetes bacterium]|nr:hypothetical protein [Bacteroidota bacterium]
MPKAKRKLKNVEVLYISLVDAGANKKKIIWKSADSGSPDIERLFRILKVDAEKRMVYGIVYAPGEVDTEGDTMEAEEIEKMAYNFMAKRRTTNVDLQHDFEGDEGFVAESWLVRKNDPLFSEEPEGAWAVGIKVTNDDTWEAVKKGDIGGLSMGGFSEAEPLGKAEDKQHPIRKFFSRLFTPRLPVSKDFLSEYKQTTLRSATWALNDALMKVIDSPEIEDKEGAIRDSVEQFMNFINGEMTMKDDGKKPDDNNQPDGATPAVDEQLNALTEKLDTALSKIDDLGERLEKVEKASPGKQSAAGRDDDDQNQKPSTGLPII